MTATQTTLAGAVAAGEKPPRRALRFDSLDAVLAEVERLVDAERAGRLRLAGNWPLGQTLGHLAAWASYPLDGYPPEIRPPFVVRFVLRLMLNRFLTKGLQPGVKLPRILGGTLGLEPLDTDAGHRRLRITYARLAATAPSIPNPVFGRMTHDQWLRLNLRHAELHLGHLLPD